GDRPVGRWVEVPALLWLEELGADRDGRPVPPQPAHDVGRPRWLVCPAAWQEVWAVGGEVEPVATFRDRPVALERHRTRLTTKVQILSVLCVQSDLCSFWHWCEVADRIPHGRVRGDVRAVGGRRGP